MHHGTCVTHVPWCMSGSLTCGDGENVPGIPGACAPAILRIWQEAHANYFILLYPIDTVSALSYSKRRTRTQEVWWHFENSLKIYQKISQQRLGGWLLQVIILNNVFGSRNCPSCYFLSVLIHDKTSILWWTIIAVAYYTWHNYSMYITLDTWIMDHLWGRKMEHHRYLWSVPFSCH